MSNKKLRSPRFESARPARCYARASVPPDRGHCRPDKEGRWPPDDCAAAGRVFGVRIGLPDRNNGWPCRAISSLIRLTMN